MVANETGVCIIHILLTLIKRWWNAIKFLGRLKLTGIANTLEDKKWNPKLPW